MISILLSTYNRLDLLKNCLKFISNQTYEDYEIVLVDDCSSDQTSQYVQQEKTKNIKIKYFRNKENYGSRFGHTYIWKQMLKLMNGEYFISLCDDNYWPDKYFLENSIKIFNKHKSLSKVIGSQVNYYFDSIQDFQYFNYDQINSFILTKDKRFYFHNSILPDGYMTGSQYLKLFSQTPLNINIATDGTIFKTEIFKKSLTLETKNHSKWQAGYELSIPCSFFGDVYYLNSPTVVVGLHKDNMSFNATQKLHYLDTLYSVQNSFENLNKFNFSKEKNIFLQKTHKNFLINVSKSYIGHSINIVRDGSLTLNTDENIKHYVGFLDVFKKLKFNILDYNLMKHILFLYILKLKNIFFKKN